MPAKPYSDKKNWMENVKESLSSVFDFMFLSAYSSIDKGADMMLDKIEHRSLQMQRILVWNLAGAIVIGLSAVFLVTSLYFYLVEFQQISKPTSFLILAIILFIAGIYLNKVKGGVHNGEIRK